MEEILKLLEEFGEKWNLDYHHIKIFKDGGGGVYDEDDEEIFEFSTIDELKKLLKTWEPD